MLPRSSWLTALGAFESAARHQNFARAADELHLTASAVSHHVRKLEAQLGVVLFRRHARGVSLTPEGRQLSDASAAALSEIDTVVEGLRRGREVQRVRVTMLPSFAACWFTPRIARFAVAFPDVRVTIDSDRAMARFEHGGPDFGIRFGLGPWPGLRSQRLMDDSVFAAASPALPGVKGIREAAQVAALPLIADLSQQGWRDWFRAAGLRRVRLPALHQIADTSDAMLAAAGGLGAVLARKRLAAGHLARGSLRRLPGPEIPSRYSYFVVHPADRALSPGAQCLIDWLHAESGRDS